MTGVFVYVAPSQVASQEVCAGLVQVVVILEVVGRGTMVCLKAFEDL